MEPMLRAYRDSWQEQAMERLKDANEIWFELDRVKAERDEYKRQLDEGEKIAEGLDKALLTYRKHWRNQ